jgi:hypothetical protein
MKCQCPCNCKNEADGLEDLCRYCLEYHEYLRTPNDREIKDPHMS